MSEIGRDYFLVATYEHMSLNATPTKSALNRHLKAHEKRAAECMFTCATCGETFHNRAPYSTHVRTAHQQQTTNHKHK